MGVGGSRGRKVAPGVVCDVREENRVGAYRHRQGDDARLKFGSLKIQTPSKFSLYRNKTRRDRNKVRISGSYDDMDENIEEDLDRILAECESLDNAVDWRISQKNVFLRAKINGISDSILVRNQQNLSSNPGSARVKGHCDGLRSGGTDDGRDAQLRNEQQSREVIEHKDWLMGKKACMDAVLTATALVPGSCEYPPLPVISYDDAERALMASIEGKFT